jgi:hypothetical protein
MKKYLFAFSLLQIFVVFAYAQETEEWIPVTIVNNIGSSIDALFIKPSTYTDDDWSDNILTALVPDGESFSFSLSYPFYFGFTYDIIIWDWVGFAYSKWEVVIALPESTIVFTDDDYDAYLSTEDY